MQHCDIAIIGAGPAGLSAALNARVRNKSVFLFSLDHRETGLYKAELLENILGTPSMTGPEYLEFCLAQVEARGVSVKAGRVLSVMPFSGKFMIACGADVYSASCVILATGLLQKSSFPGELSLLGKGVSYCATCDGMLYRQKSVCLIAQAPDSVHEANYLAEIGCEVTVVSSRGDLEGLSAAIVQKSGKQIKILGETQVEALQVKSEIIPCSAVFILRNRVAMESLVPNLKLTQGHIRVNRKMESNIPGIYAAGDCIGAPYQISKATGEGQIAALNACEYLDTTQKKKEM